MQTYANTISVAMGQHSKFLPEISSQGHTDSRTEALANTLNASSSSSSPPSTPTEKPDVAMFQFEGISSRDQRTLLDGCMTLNSLLPMAPKHGGGKFEDDTDPQDTASQDDDPELWQLL
jgi:hypothetical protein